MNKSYVIAEYDYLKKHFILLATNKEDPKKVGVNVYFYHLNDDKRMMNLTVEPKELALANLVLSKITISSDSSNHYNVGQMYYNNKTFQMMFDTCSELRFFYEINDSGLATPSQSDLLYLNNFYNSELALAMEKANDEQPAKPNKSNKLYKTLTLAAGAVAIVFATNIITEKIMYYIDPLSYADSYSDIENFYSEINLDDSYDETEKVALNHRTGNTFATEIILASIAKNDNLTDEEKELLSANVYFFNQNSEYVNLDVMTQRFETLKIEYLDDAKVANKYNVSELASGFYATKSNVIFMMPEYHDRLDVLFHEYLHVMTATSTSFGFALREGMTENLNREYFSIEKFKAPSNLNPFRVYEEPRIFANMIAEIIDPQFLVKYHFNGDITEIVDQLASITGNKEDAINLITAIDDAQRYRKIYSLHEDDEIIDEAQENLYASKIKAVELLSTFFEAKKGYSASEDLIMASYIKQLGILNNDKLLLDDQVIALTENGVSKRYYSEKLIQENEEALIKYNVTKYVELPLKEAQEQKLVFPKLDINDNAFGLALDPLGIPILSSLKPIEKEVTICDEILLADGLFLEGGIVKGNLTSIEQLMVDENNRRAELIEDNKLIKR